MKVINIIAPNIKNGGGKELLEYLLEYLNDNYVGILVNVYVDTSFNVENTCTRNVFVVTSGLNKAILFFKRFENAIYFGNLPPINRSKGSIVYFHNQYLLMSLRKLFSNKNNKIINLIKEMIKQFYINFFIKNVDYVACQTNAVSQQFKEKYLYENIKILPFFRTCKNISTVKEFDYCYISLAHPHKNHKNLFDALNILEVNKINLSMAVTVESSKKELIQIIEDINKRGIIKIVNFGVVPKEKVCEVYSLSKCLIFPSLEESFGLPLIEAVDMGLDVISSDLDYVCQIINPYKPIDIKEKFHLVINRYKEFEGMGKKSLKIAKLNFEPTNIVKSFLENI